MPFSQIREGKIQEDTITFKCESPNGDNILTWRGRLIGDQIEFTWKHDIRDDNPLYSCCSTHGLFGPSAPASFIARRVEDAVESQLVAMTDQVMGRHFGAAVNLPVKDVRLESTLFLPGRLSACDR